MRSLALFGSCAMQIDTVIWWHALMHALMHVVTGVGTHLILIDKAHV